MITSTGKASELSGELIPWQNEEDTAKPMTLSMTAFRKSGFTRQMKVPFLEMQMGSRSGWRRSILIPLPPRPRSILCLLCISSLKRIKHVCLELLMKNVLKILGSLSSLTHTTFEESVLYSRHGSCTGLFPGRIVSRGYVQARPRHKYSYSRWSDTSWFHLWTQLAIATLIIRPTELI